MYDNNSDIFGVIYNDVEYYYIKNAQNDVIAIADANSTVLVKYFYDAWGKITSITKADGSDITDLENDLSQNILNISTGESTPVLDENGNPVTEASISVILARINPILYRSYYYDKETEWYYLNTRYYSPDMCRFINTDGYIQTGQSLLDKNMFAYCLNNPVNMLDKNGNLAKELFAYLGSNAIIAITIAFIIAIVITTAFTSPAARQANASLYDSIQYQFSKAKTRRKAKDSDPRKHHMVAKAAKRAAPAREILESVEIDPKKSPLNLITISHGLHKNMHTKKYYDLSLIHI